MSGKFPTTRWDLVVASRADSAEGLRALGELCTLYRPPLVRQVQRVGYSRSDSEELTDDFLAKIIEVRLFQNQADPALGRLRNFLCIRLKWFLNNQHRDQKSLVAGKFNVVSASGVDFDRIAASPDPDLPPDEQFDRDWARAVMTNTFDKLRTHYAKAGRLDRYEELRPELLNGAISKRGNPEQVAKKLGTSPTAVNNTLSRMRKRFRETLRNEVSDTIRSDQELDAEIRYLVRLLKNELNGSDSGPDLTEG